jgi:uncharacterized SAM-binding protein YcdF (DUF218 family)
MSFKYPVILVLLPLMYASCALFQPSPEKLNRMALKAHPQYDAIIVPGVPFNPPVWDSVMKMRVIWAVHLYKQNFTKKIIMSGGSVYSPYVESRVMKLYAIEMGVPAEDILIEEKAEHSTENAWYSYQLGLSSGYKHIAFASDPFQTRLLYRFVRKRCDKMNCMPVIMDTLKILPNYNPVIDHEPLKLDSFQPITETQSFRYRFRGTRGKNINFKD